MYTSWRFPGQDYAGATHEWLPLGHPPVGKLPAGTALSAVSRASDYIDVFVIATDGNAYRVSWTISSGWGDWENISTALTRKFTPGATIASVSRSPYDIDLFAISNGEVVRAVLVDGSLNSAGHWYPVGRGDSAFDGRASIAAASGGERDLIVFVAGSWNSAWSRRWDGNDWGHWKHIQRAANSTGFAGSALSYPPALASLAVVSTKDFYQFYIQLEHSSRPGVARLGFITVDRRPETWGALTPIRDWGGDLASDSPLSAVLEVENDVGHMCRFVAITPTGKATTTKHEVDEHGSQVDWRDAGGWFPPGSQIAVVAAGHHCHLFGVAKGRVFTRDVVNDTPVGSWRCIGGAGGKEGRGILFFDASNASGSPPPQPPPASAPAPVPAPPAADAQARGDSRDTL